MMGAARESGLKKGFDAYDCVYICGLYVCIVHYGWIYVRTGGWVIISSRRLY